MKQATVLLLVLVSVIGVTYGTFTYGKCSRRGGCSLSDCCVVSKKTAIYGTCRPLGSEGDDCLSDNGSVKKNPGGVFVTFSPCKLPLQCVDNNYDGQGTCQMVY